MSSSFEALFTYGREVPWLGNVNIFSKPQTPSLQLPPPSVFVQLHASTLFYFNAPQTFWPDRNPHLVPQTPTKSCQIFRKIQEGRHVTIVQRKSGPCLEIHDNNEKILASKEASYRKEKDTQNRQKTQPLPERYEFIPHTASEIGHVFSIGDVSHILIKQGETPNYTAFCFNATTESLTNKLETCRQFLPFTVLGKNYFLVLSEGSIEPGTSITVPQWQMKIYDQDLSRVIAKALFPITGRCSEFVIEKIKLLNNVPSVIISVKKGDTLTFDIFRFNPHSEDFLNPKLKQIGFDIRTSQENGPVIYDERSICYLISYPFEKNPRARISIHALDHEGQPRHKYMFDCYFPCMKFQEKIFSIQYSPSPFKTERKIDIYSSAGHAIRLRLSPAEAMEYENIYNLRKPYD